MVSVLLPTRGRVPWLVESIDTLYSLAWDPAEIEVLFRADDDDDATIEACRKLLSLIPGRLFVGPRGGGYHDMCLWINHLASQARGDWLLVWNDDVTMTTQWWDQYLYHTRIDLHHRIRLDDISALHIKTLEDPAATEFMFVRRKMTQILGHYAMSPHSDNYIVAITGFLGMLFPSTIEVSHKSRTVDDTIRKEVLEAYKITSPECSSPASLRNKLRDLEVLTNWIEEHYWKNTVASPIKKS
ncbi:MAG: glycosyltransferase family 2 protein [Patescibacteria group bacterium]|nr:glycosyltransferase family 2 protein [Patescibacteria group bacterium]